MRRKVMFQDSKVLQVPYFVQPTDNTCQSTVLKMMASYIEQHVVRQVTGAADRNIIDIWKAINQDPKRPFKGQHNDFRNMQWWLQTNFPSVVFQFITQHREDDALKLIVQFINIGFPVLVGVSHAHTHGHIILVIGYENYQPNVSSLDLKLVVHDPFGRFDPSLGSKLFGGRLAKPGLSRWSGGSCLQFGGEDGPGRGIRLPITGASRQRAPSTPNSPPIGTYNLLSAAGQISISIRRNAATVKAA
jgi:hypothetical protein